MLTHRTGHPLCALLVSLGLLLTALACGAPPGLERGPGTAGEAAVPPPSTDVSSPAVGETPVLTAAPPTAQPVVDTPTPPPTATVAAAEDKVYQVELIAADGVLQGHGRHETKYGDLVPGSASLASGSHLRTLEGEAFVVLPGESILRMGPETEVQVGLYENGIMIWQRSGQTWHSVEPREGAIYLVATPFMTVEAVGTEFQVRINWPAEGWAAVLWGETRVVGTEVEIDPVTGATIGTRDVYEFVPEGYELVRPEPFHEGTHLEEGEAIEFTLDEAGNVVASEPMVFSPEEIEAAFAGSGSLPPEDRMALPWREVVDTLRMLTREHRAGRTTDEEYRQQLADLLDVGPGLVPPGEEPAVEGRLWGGQTEDGQVLSFCLIGNTVTMVRWVAELQCKALGTGEQYSFWEVLSLGGAGLAIAVGDSGGFSMTYDFPVDSIYAGLVVSIDGTIGATGGGRVVMSGYSQTDVEDCWTGDIVIPVQSTGVECIY